MNPSEVVDIMKSGETIRVRFKRGFDSQEIIASEIPTLTSPNTTGMLYVDEMKVANTGKKDVDEKKVLEYIRKMLTNIEDEDIQLNSALYENLNILSEENMTLGGLLFFGKNPQRYRPAFCIKAISFFGNSIGGTEYRDSKDIIGTIPEMFCDGMRFFTGNLRHVQRNQNFNTIGILEISKIALEELLLNALIHRDYMINAPIRLMIFDNRIEIISPGHLPNNLTVERIKLGNAVVRNNLIISYCSKLMNYRGFGSGVVRSIENQPNIEFFNDEAGEQFVIKIPRGDVATRGGNIATYAERPKPHVATPNVDTADFMTTSKADIDTQEFNIATPRMGVATLFGSAKKDVSTIGGNIATIPQNNNVASMGVGTGTVLDERIIFESKNYLTLEEIAEKVGRNKVYLKNHIIKRLITEGKLERLYPSTPNHPKQKYRAKQNL